MRGLGRVVPRETLLKAIERVPRAVEELSPLADFTATINTDGPEPALVTEGESWGSFARRWQQACPPPQEEGQDQDQEDQQGESNEEL